MSSTTIRRGRASAFTLIELLVVIAIIAILAAILFPVFAQARQAARGAASISNLKQLTLGVLMYEQDYDSQYPMFQSWQMDAPVSWGGPTNWTMWTFTTAPYLKNSQIFADPLYGPSSLPSWNQSVYPDYGYNYTTLSPTFVTTSPWQFQGTSEATILAPAATVMFTGRWDEKEAKGNCYYGPSTLVDVGNAEAPDCTTIPSECWTDWSPGGNNACVGLQQTEVAGWFTGGDSVRKSNNMNYSFVDGHAKFMQPGQGAAGSSWYLGIPNGTIKITNPSIYLWQVIPTGV